MFKSVNRNKSNNIRKKNIQNEEEKEESNDQNQLKETKISGNEGESEENRVENGKEKEEVGEEYKKKMEGRGKKPLNSIFSVGSNPKPKAKTLLSFEDDEMDGNAEEKSKGKKSMRNEEVIIISAEERKSSQHSFGTYDPSSIEKLRKNAISYRNPAPKSREENVGEVEVNDNNDIIPMEEDKATESIEIKEETRELNPDEIERMEIQDEEQDEEFKRWEISQIKKGGAGSKLDKESVDILNGIQKKKSRANQLSFVSHNLNEMNLDDFEKRMDNIVGKIDEEHKSLSSQCKDLLEDIESSQKSVLETELEKKKSNQQYQFYQEMREFVTDLSDCLAIKAVEIETFENELMKYDIEIANRKKESWQHSVWSKIFESPLTGDEKRESLLDQSEKIFADASEDFTSIKPIKKRFEEWKFGNTKSYDQSYCSLSVPMAFAPFVRLQLLKWDPLTPWSGRLDEMDWFTELFSYGIPPGSEGVDNADEDSNLLPKLITRIVGPKVVRLLSDVWFPGSTVQTRRAINLIKTMADFTESPKELEKYFSALMQNIVHTMERLELQKQELRDENLFTLYENISEVSSSFPSSSHFQNIVYHALLNGKIIPHLRKTNHSVDYVLYHLEKIIQNETKGEGKDPNRFRLLSDFASQFHKRVHQENNQNQMNRMSNIMDTLNRI
eukprot:TRINITY_DN2710_c0_g1_i3.p1 TRINITY_DN2710_c0_g1~~TRINITY_DN2710_c0_g1_i3.p1  ORF type:complete len:671 (+),score=254.62 TRINITY_DN2710_c0_g1_i3:204-2216(+)